MDPMIIISLFCGVGGEDGGDLWFLVKWWCFFSCSWVAQQALFGLGGDVLIYQMQGCCLGITLKKTNLLMVGYPCLSG